MLIKLSPRIDFISPVSHLFDTDGNLVHRLEELEEGQSYVAANNRRFIPANYGRTGEAFFHNRGGGGGRYTSSSASQQLNFSRRRRSLSSKSSSADSASKPSSGSTEGKIIKIINNDDPSLSERVLLNLKTSQTFEEVVRDLGQVLRIRGADPRIYALDGREVRSFSHLRQQFHDEMTFVIAAGPAKVNRELARLPRTHSEPALRRSLVAASGSGLPPRSAATESPVLRDTDSPGTAAAGGSIKILINGVRKIYYPPMPAPPEDLSPPGRRPVLEWVFGYRGADQTRNLWVLEKGGELVYYVGAVVVIYHRMEEWQRHYTGHSEDIQCLDVHPQVDS